MAKRVLFIDRDGTILVEPDAAHNYQIDSFERFQFVPRAISALQSIAELDYELVLASNQDGLGTDSFPTESFRGPHNLMLSTLAGEGVTFDAELIDTSFESDNAPTRKPRTGMFGRYLTDDYDMASSYVIGDRLTDVALARNLGARAILFCNEVDAAKMLQGSDLAATCVLASDDWRHIAEFLRITRRRASVERTTRETRVKITVDLDGGMESHISTGLHFLDHMLEQIVHHAGIALQVEAHGDLDVDEHHTMEDTAIVLGEAMRQALGDKRGIGRYGFALPMDDCSARVLIDLGGRTEFRWSVRFMRERVGDVPTEMFRHFFHSLCVAMQCNLHIEAEGDNDHHRIEAVFKAFARALRMAVHRDAFSSQLPTSKGVL